MKKIILTLSFIISFANVTHFNEETLKESEKNNFELVSTKYAYHIANNDATKAKSYEKLMNKINKEKTIEFRKNILETEKILVRIFKTYKNLVPKVIKYIYFEPIKTDDPKIKHEILEKIFISINANPYSKIFIKADENLEKEYREILKNVENKIIFYNLTDKEILSKISEEMKKDFNGKTKFEKIENRVELITSSSLVKEKFSLLNAYFKKEFKGVEIDDFSFLTDERVKLEETDNETRLKTFKELINGIY